MNKTILFVLPLSLMLASCASVMVSAPGGCHVASVIPTVCTGSKDNPKVSFNSNTLKASPPNVCAEPGATLEISIKPVAHNKIGSVAVIAKDPKDSWLSGTNSPDKTKIEILIPAWVAEGDHDYGFLTFDGKCLDPRINIKH